MKNMIRFATLIALMAISLLPAKADSPRKVVIEEGTNASCPPCASQNPIFQAYLDNHRDMVIPIKIQASFPGRDIMNAADPALHNGRISYYSINGVPSARVNGVKADSTPGYYLGAPADTMAIERAVDALRETTSPITLTIVETRNGNTMNVKVTVASSQALSGANKLRVVIVEHYRYYQSAGTNGETDFHNIMRKMLPNLNGETLDIAAGGSRTYEYSYAIPTTGQYALDPSMLHVVAFVQDDDTKEILQGATNAKEENYFGDLSIDNPFNIIERNGTITQEVNVNNKAETDMKVNLTIDTDAFPIPTGWSATVSPASVDVPAGGSVTVNVEVKAPKAAGFVIPGVKAATDISDKFNMPSRAGFYVMSEKPKIITFSGFTSFVNNNYFNSMTPALKEEAIVYPYLAMVNSNFVNQFSSEIDNAELMIFPLDDAPLKLPEVSSTSGRPYNYVNPLNTIETAFNTNRKIMIVSTSGMQWAFDAVNNNIDGQMQEVQDFYNAIGLSYERTKVSISGNSLLPFTVRGVAGDPIGNRLNNGSLINCNQQASIANQSYNLYNDVFSISNPAIAKPVLFYDNKQAELAMARIELDGNRIVYSSFGFESIATASVSNELFKRSVDWLMTGTAASVEDIAEGSNEELSLAISPNPMSDNAIVNYTVNGLVNKFVTITIVDIMGREVASLFSGMVEPGNHSLSFNAGSLPAGAYRMITRTMGGSGVQLPLMINR